ncbi:MAG TPA: NAD(P)-dependent oxidoreductase [Egibacteraceae bacterium]|nr:NAD(P)-dependent oxidoreductase [Egibacteraceae bacterium]
MTAAATGVPLVAYLQGARVVAVGAGPVAAAKALPLLEAAADLVVVAPEAVDEVAAAAAAGRLVWHRRRYRTGDLDGAALAIAATADPATNTAVATDAAAAGTLCVRADGGGSAAFAAAVRRGALTIAVSTGGHAPALASRLRAELERTYGPEYGQLVALLGELRRSPEIRRRLGALPAGRRRAAWRAVLDADILNLLRTGHAQTAREVATECLSSFWA